MEKHSSLVEQSMKTRLEICRKRRSMGRTIIERECWTIAIEVYEHLLRCRKRHWGLNPECDTKDVKK